MDFLDFEFDPAAVVALFAMAVGIGIAIGLLFVFVTLFYGRR